MWQVMTSPNVQWVLLSTIFLGLSSGILSSFAMLRRRSLMGDALAHAALPGICIAFMIVGERNILAFLIGALIAGMLGALSIQVITRYSRIKEDTALGLVLSVYFAFGIVLLTRILQVGGGNKAGLDKFLFGQAAAMVSDDVWVMTLFAGFIIILSTLFYKEFKLLCFDPGYANGIGYSSTWLDVLLNSMIVLIVVIGLQAVGVVLIVALLITPAAAARFWTDRLNRMVILSAVIGAISGVVGTVASTLAPRMPTGPLIVLSISALFFFSLIFSPHRGLLVKSYQLIKLRRRIARENVLRTLYELAELHNVWDQSFSIQTIINHRRQNKKLTHHYLNRLEEDGYVVEINQHYSLTQKGLNEAYNIVRNHRLWEMYLMHEEQIGADHVDRDADYIEHFLSDETVRELEQLLNLHNKSLKIPASVHPIDPVEVQ